MRPDLRGYASAVPGPQDINRLHDELQELIDDLWQVPRFSGLRRGFRPHVDCFETENPHQLTLVLPVASRKPPQGRVVIEVRTA